MRGENLYKHGLYYSSLYHVWEKMKSRCNNPNHINYADYGDRGVRVCEVWSNDFEAFYDWAQTNGYEDGLFLDRKDNSGNYCPENCRWVTRKENNNNKRNNIILTAFGKTQTVAQWAEEIGMNYWTLLRRVKVGRMTPEECVTIPVGGVR